MSVPIVAETMSRNRFASIKSNLHVNNKFDMPADNTDKLFKRWPLIDGMNSQFTLLSTIRYEEKPKHRREYDSLQVVALY